MRARVVGLLMVWLFLLTIAHVVGLVAVWWFFLRTEHGQLLDAMALYGNFIGQNEVEGIVERVLNGMSVASLALATAVIGFIALIRGRIALALVAILLIGGANLTTQVLKYGLARPDFGADPERVYAGNSLPSGHTTIAASVVVALVLVLPPRARGIAGLIGACYTALAGVATLSAGWHRPSDAVAAMLVVGGWAAVAGMVLVAVRRDNDVVHLDETHRVAVAVLAVAGLLLLAVAVLALRTADQVVTVPPDELGRGRLFAAYAGGAAGVAGSAGLLVALVLSTVHRVVPHRDAPVHAADAGRAAVSS